MTKFMNTTRSKIKNHPEGFAIEVYGGGILNLTKLATVYGATEAETIIRAQLVQEVFTQKGM